MLVVYPAASLIWAEKKPDRPIKKNASFISVDEKTRRTYQESSSVASLDDRAKKKTNGPIKSMMENEDFVSIARLHLKKPMAQRLNAAVDVDPYILVLV